MGNALGGMVFIVAGIVVGYLVLTGRMQKILTGQTTQSTTQATPLQQPVQVIPPSGSSQPFTMGGGSYSPR